MADNDQNNKDPTPKKKKAAPKTKSGTKKNPPHAPSKLTPEVTKIIVQKIRRGNYIEIAAESAGISKVTFYNWYNKGRDDYDAGIDSDYATFFNAVRKAERDCEDNWVHNIIEASADNPKILLEMLSRRFKERWSPKTTTSVTVEEANLEELTDEELEQIAKG